MAIANNKTLNFIIKFAVHCGIIFFLSLAGMRFYAGHLEREVAAISRTIEQLSIEEMSISQQLSALKSPNIIYSYCKDTLKMQRSTNVGVLKMNKIE
jgi:cell division protein FtsB